MLIRFGNFELDVVTYELRDGTARVPLQPKVFDVIRLLIEHRDRVVSKHELLERLWRGEHVNETAVPWTISRARRALGQAADAQTPIETIRGRGYRFVVPVEISRMEGRKEDAPRTGGGEPNPSRTARPFVGRSGEMQALLGSCKAAAAGTGSLVLLSGERGIGKTRCLTEFSEAVLSGGARGVPGGARVWSGRCIEGGKVTAFWPWAQVLRDAEKDESLSADERAQARTLVDELAPPDGGGSLDASEGGSPATRFWVIDRIARFVLLAARKQPRFIVIDDVHWADDSSLDCLAFLAPELPKRALLVVIGARDGFLSEGGEELGLRVRPHHRIELSGLSEEDVERYVLASTGWALAPEVHAAMHTKSGGNPLLLEETIRVLLAREQDPSRVQADAIDVPRFARDIVQARLQGVSPAACEFLEIASAIGQEFTLPLVQAAMNASGGEVLVHLDEAHRARLVIRGQSFGAVHAFAHDAIRETLYAELSIVRRVDVHLRLADALESRPDGALGSVAELAFHLHRALPQADAVRAESHARAAAEAAVRRCAHEDAAKFYGWALDAQGLRASDPLERCKLLIELGGALRMSSKEMLARERIGEAIAIARQHRSGQLLYEAANRLRAVVSMAILPDEVVRGALEEASELTTEAPSPLRVRILALLACIPPYSTDPARSRGMAERAEAMARPLGDDVVLAQALLSRLPGLSAPDHLPRFLAIADEVAGGSLKATLFQQTEAHQARYHALLMRADRAGSDRAFEDVRRLAGMLRGTDKLWQCTRLMATRDFHAGRLAAADAAFDELRVRAERLRLSYAGVYRGSYLSASARLRGGSAELIAVAPEVTAALSWISHLPVVTANRSLYLLYTGRVDAARAEFEAFWDKGLERYPGDQSALHTLGALSYVAVRLGHQEHALTLYQRLLPFDGLATLNAVGFHHGPVAHHLGALAVVLDRPEDAVSHLDDALATCRRMGWELHEPQTLTMLCRALFGSGRRTDNRRAQECLLESHALATDLGLAPEVQSIEGIARTHRIRLPEGGGAISSAPPDRPSELLSLFHHAQDRSQ